MNIVENEAIRYAKSFYRISSINNLATLKNNIDQKLSQFKRDKDKLDFLKILRIESEKELQAHLLNCKKEDCLYHKEREYGFFAIDQEIDNINEYYTFEPQSKDKFTAEEEASLHEKLNIVIDNLEKVGLANEVIFNEIESLKGHFNLGKKNWGQLVVGNLYELMVNNLIDSPTAKHIIKTLSEGDLIKLLSTLND